MKKLLYIKSSPRGERSYSTTVAAEFLKAYRSTHEGDTIKEVDVFRMAVPAFDGAVLDSKYAILNGKPHTEEQKKAWAHVEKVIAEFKDADKYVISVPMWNFGIPYRLKQYFDVLIQPGYTFSFSPADGYKGLVTGKPVTVVYARGGDYPAGTPYEAYDLQKKYVELVLGFIGFTGIESIVVGPTLAGPDAAAASKTAGLARARELAAKF